MIELELRTLFAHLNAAYLGCATNDARQAFLVDVYNLIRPLPRGINAQHGVAWCAIQQSAVAKMCGFDDIFPFEQGCWEMMKGAQAKGIWKPNTYTPQVGDLILYDWASRHDGVPDHVGCVEVVGDNYVTTIEGNNSGKCSRRTIARSDAQILGYIAPNYAALATDKPATPEKPTELIQGADGYDAAIEGQYTVKTALYLRRGAGVLNKIVTTMPKNATVTCSGYYANVGKTRWYYVAFGNYVGWCSSKYLTKT